MKRKLLKDSDMMSGSGWLPEDCDCFECPYCGSEIEINDKNRKVKCLNPDCEKVSIVERGVQYLVRLKEIE